MSSPIPSRRRRNYPSDGTNARDDNASVEIPRTTYPDRRPRRKRGGELSAETVRILVKRMAEDARNYNDNDLAPIREKSWRYYNGKVDHKPKKGRSGAVDRVVRDTVDGILPQLIKVFASSQHVARYSAETAEDQQMADQATKYAHHVFNKQNNGFRQLYDHLKDGLVGGLGVFRCYCAHSKEVTQERYEGLTQDEFTLLLSDDTEDVEVLEVEQVVSVEPPAPLLDEGTPNPTSSEAAPPGDVPPPTGGPPSTPSQPGGPPGMPPDGTPATMPPPAGAMPPPGGPPQASPPGGAQIIPFKPGALTAPQPNVHINCTIKRTHIRKRIVIDTVDPSEFVIDRRATCEDDAYVIGMDSLRPASDVIAMGIDADIVAEIQTAQDDDRTGEKQARRPTGDLPNGADDMPDDDALDRTIRVYDLVVRIDQDGDGVAERRRIVALGNEFRVVRNEPTDEVPYAIGSPILVPHSAVGQGIGELVIDLNDIQTAILRQQLDSLYQAVNPRTIAVENQVTIQDIVDNQFNGVIRCRAPGMVQPYNVDFVGQQAFPMVERLDQIKQNRTGLSEASQGLDADALQSSTEVGVRAVIGAALQKIELLARVYAETSITRLFRMILALAVKYQQEPMTILDNGQPFEVDPRAWKADMQVDVDVGLGRGNEEERRNTLLFVLAKQEQVLLQLGPTNPLCDLSHYQSALADFMALTPYKNTERYFKKPTPADMQALEQKMAAAAQAKSGGDAQAKMAKVQADAQAKQMKMQADAQQGQMKLQLQAAEGQQDRQLQTAQAQADLHLQAAKTQGEMELQNAKAAAEMRQTMVEIEAEAALKKYEIDRNTEVAKEQAKAANTDTRLRNPSRDH